MERDRAQLVQPLERGREQVLAVMLLHMIESPRPVDCAMRQIGLQRLIQHMPDHAVFDLHIQHRRAVERRLSLRGKR